MDPLEQIMLRMKDLQPQIPSWAKAEHMEHGIFLWKFVPLSLAKPHKDWICAHIRVPLSTVKIG